METITIGIKGMSCSACVKSVTEALKGIEGINSVEVSLELNQAVINFDSNKVHPNQFSSAIEGAGFDVA